MPIEQTTLFEEEQFPEILDFIPVGKENAVSMQYLAALRNTDARTIRSMVHKARVDGHVIVGDDHGYYKPSCEGELMAWIIRYEASIISKYKALQGARIALKEGRYEDR